MGDQPRRDACVHSFRRFCETYFPGVFYWRWSEDHRHAIRLIETVVLEGGLFALAMPRGSGKTVLCERAALWAVLYGHRRMVALIGATQPFAVQRATNLKTILATNELLHADFPEATVPFRRLYGAPQRRLLYNGEPVRLELRSDVIMLADCYDRPCAGAVIYTAGISGNVRGPNVARRDGTVMRPELVVLDDPQTRESAASISQRDQHERIINGDILGLAGPGQPLAALMPCTVIEPDDLAERLLDRKRNPQWQGSRTQMVTRWPERADLWDEYMELRRQAMVEHVGNPTQVTEVCNAFYAARRAEMDRGGAVSWPARMSPGDLSALQHAYNERVRVREEAFFAEYQNEPLAAQATAIIVTPDDIAQRCNRRPRGEVPTNAPVVTAFIDVGERVLWWCAVAWAPGFTGAVIDYGTWPDQRTRHVHSGKLRRTLQQECPKADVDGAVLNGLLHLGPELLGREWPVFGGGTVRLARLLIDAGHLPGVVHDACRQLGPLAMPSRGDGVSAARRPMTSYVAKPGEQIGWHWMVTAASKPMRHARYDTNHWKTFIHARLATVPGDVGALTLFGTSPDQHRTFASHVGAAEYCTETQGHGRTVWAWQQYPSKPDNHWFDCLVGAAVAASMAGVDTAESAALRAEVTPRRRRQMSREEFTATLATLAGRTR